ncbi:LOW QUALITY PROTEIN: methylcrotonoyl-CoA carboxylase beta chain, mitochondrial-like [Sinocyclocheilus anshuiensis]|uniref:LOW QUALITY PROTEIN: methylcrotonoyl-CoA carboxylase beta chain, mitochondrial-like n=1 Tax=Sinocyclocheilus anshuiensis TaxID=1608454 RepID=UPI0007B837A9|nr:PREDICTED: LOW QUALITY PROTEIN: methylcrotonoyl-CoA carboxylase beta chain, mitochondrial-like [Sinocyclocheilus anshuiensis]
MAYAPTDLLIYTALYYCCMLRSSHIKGNKLIELTRASFSQNPLSWDTSSNLFSCTAYHCTHSPVSGGLWRALTHRTHQPAASSRCMSSTVRRRCLPSAFPVIDGEFHPAHRHVYEANIRNCLIYQQKYLEHKEKVMKGGGENVIARQTQRNRKVLVRDRLRMLLDDEDYLELSPFAGLGLPYGDIPSAGCLTGSGQMNGLWCMFIANDATVKGGTTYPITVKKQLRAQVVAMQNRLPSVYLVDSGGAFLPLQSEIFPERNHGGRTFYNEAVMSAMKIPQVAVVCGSCTAVGAYVPTMSEEAVIVHRIGTIFLGGPPLVKAATGEEVSPEDLGGARLHSDHQIGIVANNGELTHEASLKGSHIVQLCDQRDIPLIFMQNTAPEPAHTISQAKCGRAFDPNFLFLWPNARVSILAPGHSDAFVLKTEEEITQINEMLEEESSAFFSSGRLWDDGVIRPQDTRKVLSKCLKIIKQQDYQLSREKMRTPFLRL